MSIKDTGIGIKPENLNLIFERFEQEEVASNRKFGGTGLGLSIVKKLVTLQNGKIDVLSEVGKGTEFIVEIPYEVKILSEIEKVSGSFISKKNPAPKKMEKRNYKILAAEDNRMNQTLLRFIFKQWELSFDLAEDGQVAFEMIKQGAYDIVLMDIQMPVMDGYEATRKIRNELQNNLPIIAMTANILPGEKEKCLKTGMTDYISKPINENILQEMLIKYLPAKIESGNEVKMNFIDIDYFKKTYTKEFTKEIIDQFEEQYPVELEELSDFVQAKDFFGVCRLSHHMKTTVSVLNTKSPLLHHLEAIEMSDNSPSGWEIIRFNMSNLLNSKNDVLAETNTLIEKIR